VVGGLGAPSKVLRLLLQSALLAVGAWLVIHEESTLGIIIAGSILGGRALDGATGVITAGDPVMLIVPESDTLMVEAKVEPRDIDQV
jgi:ABC-type protease/lipase transport system fused ATPase/permease subunit